MPKWHYFRSCEGIPSLTKTDWFVGRMLHGEEGFDRDSIERLAEGLSFMESADLLDGLHKLQEETLNVEIPPEPLQHHAQEGSAARGLEGVQRGLQT